MTADTMQVMLGILLATIAIATFVLKGKQWPTFISATLLGMFLGSTSAGTAVVKNLAESVASILKNLS
jgi:hypothetical protein